MFTLRDSHRDFLQDFHWDFQLDSHRNPYQDSYRVLFGILSGFLSRSLMGFPRTEHIHRHSNRNSYRDSHRDFRLKVSPFKVGWPLEASQRFVNTFDRLPGTSRVIDSLHETQGHFWLRNQGQLFSYMLGETWLGGGEGNPPTRDNFSPYKQPLKKVLLTSVTEWIPARNAISWATVREFQVFTKTCQKQPRASVKILIGAQIKIVLWPRILHY